VGEAFFVAGTLPFAVLGVLHLAMTLRDVRRPTFFAPTDDALVPALDASGVVVLTWAPAGRSMWRAWLGANLTHALGLIVFALFPLAIALHDYALVAEIPGVRLLCVAVALAYAAIAARFWFLPATALTCLGLACFVVAAVA
jgi:hypothetical protein